MSLNDERGGMSSGSNPRSRRYDPVDRKGQVGISFEPIQFFGSREAAARMNSYPSEDRVWTGIDLGRDLLTTRARVEYCGPLSIALLYLFVKGFNDLLAAVSISKSGYSFQSWPLIRGGFEAAELMDYLSRHPENTEKWVDKETRFDSLSWLRNELPQPDLRQQLYDDLNDITHANLRPIDAFNTLRIGDGGIRYLVVGPNPLPIYGANPVDLVSSFISYPVRVLWQSDRGVMDRDWVARFHSFDAETKFVFGEAWGDTKQAS